MEKKLGVRNKRVILCILFGAIAPSIMLSHSVFAEDYYASINTTGDVDLVTTSGTVIDNSDITVTTNCRAGYNLTLGLTVNNNNLYLDGNSSNYSNSTRIAPSDGTNALKDSPDTWGFFAPSAAIPITPTENNIFRPVPTSVNNPAVIRTTSETASQTDIDDTFSIYYGANVGPDLLSGTYEMIPENSQQANSPAGSLAYYLTTDMSCVSDLNISFNKNMDGAGSESDPGSTVANFPTSADNIIDAVNHTVTLSTKRPTRTGYQFKEWNTEPDGTGNYYRVGETIKSGTDTSAGELTGDVTLYAIWVENCAATTICYDGNHADAGTMPTQTGEANRNIALIPSNFSRAGYAFTGWNTEADGSGTQYGPNQNFLLPSAGDTLYAQWLAPTGVLQTWAGASSMNVGDVIALTDNRDGEVYMVAKLADNKVWITENLRLVPNSDVDISVRNTNMPTSDFVNAYKTSSASGMCSTDDATCDNSVQYNTNNLNRNLTPSYTNNDNVSSWYSYGTMYNWYTATAGNGTYSMISGNAAGDLCPSGWHLPTGGSSGEWGALNAAVNNGATNNDTGLRVYPVNFIRSGDYNPSEGGGTGRGHQGRIWSATAMSQVNAYRMGYSASDASTTNKGWNKWDGFAMRCIYQGGNIPYVDVDVDFVGSGITSLTFTNPNQPDETATPSNPTVPLAMNVTYTVTATLTSGYEVANWATTSGGVIGDTTTVNPAPSVNTYVASEDATLTITGQAIPSYSVAVTLGEHVNSISFTNADYGTQTITPAGETCTDNGDGTYTCTVNLRRGVTYTISATYEEGYGIDAWATGAGGTLGDASSAVTTYIITAPTTLSLTAEEKDEITYQLVYSAGTGSDAPDSETIISYNTSESFTVTNSTPIYYGYNFTGWSETADGNGNGTTVDYVSGDTITINSTGFTNTKTLYPVYEAVTTCPANNICYYDNGADVINGGRGTMANQTTNTMRLIPPNYSRAGYGFAGWVTAENATPFGPNAEIDSTLAASGLGLYAKWVKSTGSLQNWSGCGSLASGSVTALTDTRDGQTYAVAKLADGGCWTIENLRLDPSDANITASNTNNPTAKFIEDYPQTSSLNILCKEPDDENCINSIQYNTNNINRSTTPSYNTAASTVGWYGYGVYYNWHTATAGNGVYNMTANTNAAGDLCPSGWHLPTGNTSGEFNAMNGLINSGRTNNDSGWRAYPNNFVWSGDYNNIKRTNAYTNGRLWSATTKDNPLAYRLGHANNSVTSAANGSYNKWDAFAIRCVISGSTSGQNNQSNEAQSEPDSSPDSNGGVDTNSTNNSAPLLNSASPQSGTAESPDSSASTTEKGSISTVTSPEGVTLSEGQENTNGEEANNASRVGFAVATAVATTTGALSIALAYRAKKEKEEEQ